MKINPDNTEQSLGTPLERTLQQVLSQICITTQPVFITGVNRKINLGNFESNDVFAGLALPLPHADPNDLDQLEEILTEVADRAFALCASQTYARYLEIKNLQSGVDPKQTPG